MNDYKLSEEEALEIKSIEELLLEAYLCQGGKWTVGYSQGAITVIGNPF